MHAKKKRFIAIEGTDGSGKGTQANLLVERLKKDGRKITVLDFPQYGEPSAYFVEEYLNGSYGHFADISPKVASLFYALDRFDVSKKVREDLAKDSLILSNRYVASNLAHQGAKIENSSERSEFFKWIYNLEYEILGIPRPDLNILLFVPAETAYKLIDKKNKRKYVKHGKRDAHEADIEHLKKAEKVYKEISELFPEDFVLIDCTKDGELLPIETIHEKLYDLAIEHL